MCINNWLRTYTGRDYFIVVCYGLMGLSLAAGTYFRLKGLGKSPFALDEYYIASSVRNILEHGLPQFDCGGYYARGLLIQYLVAPLFKYGSNDELYFRLITVISNLLAIPALYLLGQRIAGKAVACFVVVLFSVSVWETEMARFARMYAPFQMLFAWYLYFLYKALFLKDAKARRWMYWISLISAFVFEGAIFLVTLNFIPLVVDIKKIRLSEYFASFLVFIIAYALITTDWGAMGAQTYIPTDLPRADFPVYAMRETIGPILLPVLLLPTLISDLSWTIGFAVPLILSFIAIWQLFARARLGKIGEITRLQASIISSFIIMSLFNLFGLLIALSIILIVADRLFHWFNLNTIKARSLALPVVAIVTTFGFWLSYAIFSKEWRPLLDTWISFDVAKGNIPLKQVLTILFGYPDIGFKIVRFWLKAMPIETIVISSLAIYGLLMTLVKRHSDSEGYLFLVGILVVLSLIIGVLPMQLMGMRYSFFMYPAVLLVVILSLNRLAQSFPESARFRNVYVAVLVSIFLLVSEDFNIDHLWNIDSDRILYRLKYDDVKRDQYYNRFDFRSPALLVNEGVKSGDIVISTIYSVPYYLRQLDYFYVNQGTFWIGEIMACNGKKDLWANAELIYKPEKLFALLENARSTTWLIVDDYNKWAKPELDKVREIFGHYRIYQTVDGTIEVYKIPPKKDREFGMNAG